MDIRQLATLAACRLLWVRYSPCRHGIIIYNSKILDTARVGKQNVHSWLHFYRQFEQRELKSKKDSIFTAYIYTHVLFDFLRSYARLHRGQERIKLYG